ncbi:MAG: hypothetical protein U9P63_00995 [Patescibacteria group bacterium]|nr:hypothetical protein [Patescibacteria group bacterium]
MKEKIKQLIGFIKKYLGEIMLVIGSGLFVHNIFSFSYRAYGKGGLSFDFEQELEGIAYFYSSDVLIGISIGAMLIVAGILVIKKQSK